VVVKITKTRVGQQVDLDQIDFEIHTNGAVTPREVLEEAGNIYNKITKRLVSVIKGEEDEEDVEVNKDLKKEELSSSDLDIDKLNLSARITNSLIKAGFMNLTELEGKNVDEIMEIRGLGKRSADELIDIMKSYKLKVGE